MIHVILFEPEIPENTGNIARTCVAFNACLHLIRPYGFILSSSKLKRSGVNYWEHLQLFEYDCFDDFLSKHNNPVIYMYSRYGNLSPNNVAYAKDKDIYLMFGRESTGIDKQILLNNQDHLIRIPTSTSVRSLNLANTVAIALYEVVKQHEFYGLAKSEPHKKIF